jgi:hypothetical protein
MGSRFNGNSRRGKGDQGSGHAAPHATSTVANQDTATQAPANQAAANRPIVAGGSPQQEVVEPREPEVFKEQKPGKSKVDEGQSIEKEKPFCFRCYKPGHRA